MKLGSLLAIATTIGVVVGATGIVIYDMIHFVLGHYDAD